jgi:C-terminal processing protease CtpA/Prc
VRDDDGIILRLSDLCRAWGAIKFLHPWSDTPQIDWDDALLRAMPEVESARDPDDMCAALNRMTSVLNDPLTRCEFRPARAKAAPPGPSRPVDVRVEERQGLLAAILTCPWEAYAYEHVFGNAVGAAVEGVESADVFIFDLRGGRDPTDHDAGHWWQSYAVSQAISGLITADVPLGTRSRRYHAGYRPSSSLLGYSYHSGRQVQQADVLRARPGRHTGKPFVVIVDAAAYYSAELLVGVQAAGVGQVVFAGANHTMVEREDEATLMLSSGVEVRVRASELVAPNGTVGFSPDASVKENPLEAALGLLRAIPPATRATGSYTSLQRLSVGRPEHDYPADLPPRNLRLLALFRLWAVIDFFFPYKNLMDHPWEESLKRLIPVFLEAETPEAYGLAVLEAVTALNDSHGRADVGTRCERLFGTHFPPVLLRTLGGSRVVTAVLDDECRLETGDIILSIDGTNIESRAGNLGRYTAASTKQSLYAQTNFYLLAGPPNSDADLTVRKLDGRMQRVSVFRKLSAAEIYSSPSSPSSPERWRVLPEGFGYVDMVRLRMDEVEEAMSALDSTPAIIFDIRGYPQGTAFAIAPMLTRQSFTIAQFRRCYLDGFRQDEGRNQLLFEQMLQPDGKHHYEGHVVALIDERAISHAEHSCLALEGAAPGRITFVGTPTAGANGDVTEITLPGSVKVFFTGHDVRHADGRELQRLGIQPDIWVEPTPKGLAEGRDEVLEAAVNFLRARFLGRPGAG